MAGNGDASSTVTSLFAGPSRRVHGGVVQRNATTSKRLQAKGEPVGIYDDQTYYSSSKLLRKYIYNYDKQQTLDLAKSLTENPNKAGKKSALAQAANTESVDKEIQLAKRLLPRDYCSVKGVDIESLTTDDLLVSNPYQGVLSEVDLANSYNILTNRKVGIKKDKGIPNPEAKQLSIQIKSLKKINDENTCSMHFSDIDEGSCQLSVPDFTSDHRKVIGELSNDLSLYSLNGVSYTPHHKKYRSVLPEDARNMGGGDNRLARSRETERISGTDSYYHTTMSKTAFQYLRARGDSEFVSPPLTNLLLSENAKTPPRSKRCTDNAGRTPYRHVDRSSHDSEDCGTSHTTEKILAANSEWESPLAFTLPRSSIDSVESKSHLSHSFNLQDKASNIQGFMEDCLNDSTVTERQHGTVETLKNMLFTLQGMSPNSSGKDFYYHRELTGGSGEEMDGGHLSLKRAMSHLSKVKDIVRSSDVVN